MINIILFLNYVLTSTIMIFVAYRSSELLISKILIALVLFLFSVAIKNHFKGINTEEKTKFTMGTIIMILGTAFSAAITWHINHNLGYGPIIANGFVGLLAAILISPKFSGSYYLASFIGMSSMAVIPSIMVAGIAGIVAGIVITFSTQVYAGMGGKGGTIAALSTQLVRIVLGLFT